MLGEDAGVADIALRCIVYIGSVSETESTQKHSIKHSRNSIWCTAYQNRISTQYISIQLHLSLPPSSFISTSPQSDPHFRSRENSSSFQMEDRGLVRSLFRTHQPFDDSFWHAYIDSLNKTPLTSSGDFAPVNYKKYSLSSWAVATIIKYFEALRLPKPSKTQIITLLKSPFSQGDPTRAYFLIRFFQVSTDGLFITNQNQDRIGGLINYVGAENWENVMCYLDALLFAMFANLESFEPILFVSNQHANASVTRLSALLRLYVNLLRSGNLVTTDITMRICEVLLSLGFEEAMSHKQQDLAAVFLFLTETLLMPMLTFMIEIQHGGKFSEEDDVKISKERILFVSLPEEGTEDILLEECLEHYFNNSISVRRELERRATLENILMKRSGTVEIVPTVAENIPAKDMPSQDLIEDVDAQSQRKGSSSDVRPRSDSKASNTKISMRTRLSTLSIWLVDDLDKGKLREVNLPAWMFLRLLPFYTDDNLQGDDKNIGMAKNSKEFVDRRPILPICLKRYSFNAGSSSAKRSARRIIIPPVITLPEFVADEENADIPGDYKLVLESAVCHRGTSISSGHFVSAIRKHSHDVTPEEAQHAPWMLYDDMAKKGRVVQKTFKEIFDKEWPYMLFYRLVLNEIATESASSSITTRNSAASKPFILQHGARNKYWADTLSPIMSTENFNDLSSLTKTTTTVSVASIPIPEVAPNDSRFVDIRNKYFWYAPDDEMQYYKELPTISKQGTREHSVTISPQLRRNSQWSVGTQATNASQARKGEKTQQEAQEQYINLSKQKSSLPTRSSQPKNHTQHPQSPRSLLDQKPDKRKSFHLRKKHRDDYKKERCIIT